MKPLRLAVGIGLIVCSTPSAQSQAPTGTRGVRPAATASANLVDTEGRTVGQARLQQGPHGVLVKLDLKNITPGIHGVHIHEVGRCDRPSFESAGDHFNPTNKQHGHLNPRGTHAGDLTNIEVPATTELSVEFFLADVTIDPGPRSLTDSNGSSIVIHTGKDDHTSDPGGESGDRLACGPIMRPEAK
jgi:Cu-Zn family superoxide dismutase